MSTEDNDKKFSRLERLKKELEKESVEPETAKNEEKLSRTQKRLEQEARKEPGSKTDRISRAEKNRSKNYSRQIRYGSQSMPDPSRKMAKQPRQNQQGSKAKVRIVEVPSVPKQPAGALSTNKQLIPVVLASFAALLVVGFAVGWFVLSNPFNLGSNNSTPVISDSATEPAGVQEQITQSIQDTETEPDQTEVSEEITANTTSPSYYRDDILWSGKEGYLLGDYIASMKTVLRSEPLNTSSSKGNVEQYEVLTIDAISEGLSDSVWGQDGDGNWVCLSDASNIYLYGSGQYHAMENVTIYDSDLNEVSTIPADENFYVDRVMFNKKDLWGVLEDGNMINFEEAALNRVFT